MDKILRIFLGLLIFLILSNPAYSMSRVKGWINKIRPGTFVTQNVKSESEKKPTKAYSDAEVKVLTELAKREEELKKKEALNQKRAADLKNLSQQIEQKLDQIRKMTAEFEQKRQLRKEMDEKDISKMVKLYETMAPEQTAVFLNQMDRETATQILMRMNPRKAATVMQQMDPKVAVEITEMVTRFKADRNKAAESQ